MSVLYGEGMGVHEVLGLLFLGLRDISPTESVAVALGALFSGFPITPQFIPIHTIRVIDK